MVVSRNEDSRVFVGASLQSMGVDALLLASLAELTPILQANAVNGILLELTTLVTASQQDKQTVQEVLEFFPNAKFKFVENDLRVLSHTLEGFVAECQRFKARPIRKCARKERVLAVYLAADASFDHAEKVVTANISATGIFVYSPLEWKIGDRVWLRFPENDVMLSGEIRSFHAWGNNRFIPGVGIKLDEPAESNDAEPAKNAE